MIPTHAEGLRASAGSLRTVARMIAAGELRAAEKTLDTIAESIEQTSAALERATPQHVREQREHVVTVLRALDAMTGGAVVPSAVGDWVKRDAEAAKEEPEA